MLRKRIYLILDVSYNCKDMVELTSELIQERSSPFYEVLQMSLISRCSEVNGAHEGAETPPHSPRARGFHLIRSLRHF